MWAKSITGHSISQWLPCPVPSWVSNTIGTWGGNSVKKKKKYTGFAAISVVIGGALSRIYTRTERALDRHQVVPSGGQCTCLRQSDDTAYLLLVSSAV